MDSEIKNKNKRFFIILICIFLIMLTFLFLKLSIGSGTKNYGFNWQFNDFLFMGLLLLSAGVSCEFILRRVKNTKKRIFYCGIILITLLLIWVELAIGVF